jgi:hypothetical protein
MTIVDDISVQLKERYDSDVWLGHMVWYQVPGTTSISVADWMKAINETPLRALIPRPPRAVDTFKRAVNVAKETYQTVDAAGESRKYKILPSDAGDNIDYVFRALVVEELDRHEHRLSHHHVVTFKYHRVNEQIMTPEIDMAAFNSYPADVQKLIEDKINKIVDTYFNNLRDLNDAKVRGLIKNAISNKMLGIPVRQAGILFFVGNDHYEMLMALDELVKEHLPGCDFGTFPLIRDDKQREVIRAAYEAETNAEIDQLSAEMTDILKGKRGKLTVKKKTQYVKRAAEIDARTKVYEDMLEAALDKTHTRTRLLRQQAMKLMTSR